MKITPLEIRQKTFEKKLRGYDKEEVQGFLTSISQEWERTLDEVKELKIKLQSSEKEGQKLREVENSLFKTLKTAEDAGANVVEQANKTAELHLRETQWKAEAMINEAKNSAKSIVDDSETKSRQIIGDMEDELRSIEKEYKTLEQLKDKLLSELRGITRDTIERVDKVATARQDFNLDAELKQAKREARELVLLKNEQPENVSKPIIKSPQSKSEPVTVEPTEPVKAEEPKKEEDSTSSFFDLIE